MRWAQLMERYCWTNYNAGRTDGFHYQTNPAKQAKMGSTCASEAQMREKGLMREKKGTKLG